MSRQLVFDLDGTLVTCEQRQIAVLRALCCTRGLPIDYADHWRRKRDGDSTLAALVSAGVPALMAKEIADCWRRSVEEYQWQLLDVLHEDVLETLDAMRSAGVSVHLLTARSRPEWVVPSLKRLGLIDSFESIHVVCPSDASLRKAEWLRTLRADCFVGDSETDLAAAVRADVRFVAVARGQRTARYLNLIGAKEIAETAQQLNQLLDDKRS